MNRPKPNLREELPGILGVAIVFIIFAYYGKWVAGVGVVLAVIGGKLMSQYDRRDPGFILGVLIGLAGLVVFVWGMF
jgi:type IV secretory pathway TrbD component